MNRKYLLAAVRWTARILGSLLVILVLTIAVGEGFFYPGEGLPNPFEQPLPTQIKFAGMLAILIGMLVGWKWEGIAAVLILGGGMAFHIFEGWLWATWVFGLVDLIGVLFLLCWWLRRLQKSTVGT